jgi:hypothetical protein
MEYYKLKSYLIPKILHWVNEQRKLHLPKARGLSNEEKSLLEKYFEKSIMDSVKVALVDNISNPSFYPELIKQGIAIPLDFSTADGLALVDCIILRKRLQDSFISQISTLFHEMVHVVQIDILGLEKMTELYLSSLLQKGYFNVPFEKQAYKLSARFNQRESFLVRETVEQELKQISYL